MALTIVEALGKMAGALANKKFNQGARIMRSVETLHPYDKRRTAAESRAMKLFDDSGKLRDSAEAAVSAAQQLRAKVS